MLSDFDYEPAASIGDEEDTLNSKRSEKTHFVSRSYNYGAVDDHGGFEQILSRGFCHNKKINENLPLLNYLIFISPCGATHLHSSLTNILFFIFIVLSILLSGYYVTSAWFGSSKWYWKYDLQSTIAFCVFVCGICFRTYYFYYDFDFLWLNSESNLYSVIQAKRVQLDLEYKQRMRKSMVGNGSVNNNSNNNNGDGHFQSKKKGYCSKFNTVSIKIGIMMGLSSSSLIIWMIYTDLMTLSIFDAFITLFLWYSAYFPEIAMILTYYLYLVELTYEIDAFMNILLASFYMPILLNNRRKIRHKAKMKEKTKSQIKMFHLKTRTPSPNYYNNRNNMNNNNNNISINNIHFDPNNYTPNPYERDRSNTNINPDLHTSVKNIEIKIAINPKEPQIETQTDRERERERRRGTESEAAGVGAGIGTGTGSVVIKPTIRFRDSQEMEAREIGSQPQTQSQELHAQLLQTPKLNYNIEVDKYNSPFSPDGQMGIGTTSEDSIFGAYGDKELPKYSIYSVGGQSNYNRERVRRFMSPTARGGYGGAGYDGAEKRSSQTQTRKRSTFVANSIYLTDYDCRTIIDANLSEKYHFIVLKKEKYLNSFKYRFLCDFLMLIIAAWGMLNIIFNSIFGYYNNNITIDITDAPFMAQISVALYYTLIVFFVFGTALDTDKKYDKLSDTIETVCDVALENYKYQVNCVLLRNKYNSDADHDMDMDMLMMINSERGDDVKIQSVMLAQCVYTEMQRLSHLIKLMPLYYDIAGYKVCWRNICQFVTIFCALRVVSFLLEHAKY